VSSVTIVHNPASGGSVDVDLLRSAAEQHANGHRLRWSPTTADDPGIGQARDAVERGCDAVIACGGDGTVRAVLEGVAGSNTELGIVPLGTGNLLAGNLGLADGLDAFPVALSAPATTLDTATVNGERFAVMAGVGFDAMMIRDASSGVKERFGSAAYIASAARNLPAKVVSAAVTVDGRDVFEGRTAMVLVGNCGRVTGGLEVFPDADPADGRLDLAVLSAERARDWATVLWRLVRGKPQPSELVTRHRGEVIEVHLDEPVAYELDGEDREPATELRFEIDAATLQVRR